MFQIDGSDAVLYVVLERGVADRHAPLAPFETGSDEGLHRAYGPAGEVPVGREVSVSWGNTPKANRADVLRLRQGRGQQ